MRDKHNMVHRLMFDPENHERIHAVESSFGPWGKPLSQPGRVLIGQGHLKKQSRRGPQPKVFFLFNDVLVYGSVILRGHWYKNQQIIPLEDIQLEDLEDSVRMKNQWLMRTPRKSFYVAAASREEKQMWMEHVEDYRFRLLQSGGRTPGSTFAVTWIPDQAAASCMRCSDKFTVTQRRHHCRKCGFVVCSSCSKMRAVVGHIHPTKRMRVCGMCHPSLLGAETEPQGMTRPEGRQQRGTGSMKRVWKGSVKKRKQRSNWKTTTPAAGWTPRRTPGPPMFTSNQSMGSPKTRVPQT